MPEKWQHYVRQRFPAYLLPASASAKLSAAEAERFMGALTDQRDALRTLRRVSLLVPRADQLAQLVMKDLPTLVRGLPSRTETYQRRWEGGFHGKLHLPQTLALQLEGRRTSFVTQSRVRSFELPENVLVRATCERLRDVLHGLRTTHILPSDGWGRSLRDCEGMLQHLLLATPLREVVPREITALEENAARSARGAAFQRSADWWRWMRIALDDDNPATIARIVAEGALLPLSEDVQFELAVAMRMAEALEAKLCAGGLDGWRMQRALVISGRQEMFAFLGQGDRALRIFYNQSVLTSGAVEEGARHYLARTGRMRPDITIVFERAGETVDAVVVECKNSSDAGYVLGGYHEAVVYRHEYAQQLRGKPKAVLVASSAIAGSMRMADDVVAVSWERRPGDELVANLLARIA